jgi:hypothetical protein
MTDPLRDKRPTATKAFFELEMCQRVIIAQSIGLMVKDDPKASDFEQSKLWVTRAQELGKRDTFNEAVWRIWDNRSER